MRQLSGFSNLEIEFDKDGRPSAEQVTQLTEALDGGRFSSLLVVAHGWNNDMDEARRLVARFAHSLAGVTTDGSTRRDPQHTLVLSVLWPSKRYADTDLVPSPAAGLEGLEDRGEDDEVVRRQLSALQAVFDDPVSQQRLEHARGLVPALEDDPAARARFADLVRSLLQPDAVDDEDASRQFFGQSGDQLMDRLSGRALAAEPPVVGDGPIGLDVDSGTAVGRGGAADIGQAWSNAMKAARRLLNYTTYYEMKRRAGVVGKALGSSVLRPVLQAHPRLAVHLVGHSFGGRLVTAAALAIDGEPRVQVASMSLLQAAYSHYGLAKDFEPGRAGAYRSVLTDRLVRGPIVITHTKNDTAVGKAYPIASAIAGQDASDLGDENDRFGGMGRNGAQKTPEAVFRDLLAVTDTYQLTAAVTNLRADSYVHDHGDVTNVAVAHAVASAMSTAELGQPAPPGG